MKPMLLVPRLRSLDQLRDLLKLLDSIDLCPHRDVGDALKYEFEHRGNLVLLNQLRGRANASVNLLVAFILIALQASPSATAT
jgi:hypothetical protein